MRPLVRRAAEDLRLVGRSFMHAPSAWAAALLSGAVLSASALQIGSAIGGHPGYLFGEFRLEGIHAGIMTAVSAFFLGAGAMSLGVVATLFRRSAETRELAVPWALAAAGLFVLGADDLLMLHEIVGTRMERAGVPRLLGLPHTQLPVVAYGLVTLLLVRRLLTALRVHWRALFPLACALGAFALAGLVDLAIPTERLSRPQQLVVGPMDQVAKAIGSLMMFAFAQTLLVSVATAAVTPPAPDSAP